MKNNIAHAPRRRRPAPGSRLLPPGKALPGARHALRASPLPELPAGDPERLRKRRAHLRLPRREFASRAPRTRGTLRGRGALAPLLARCRAGRALGQRPARVPCVTSSGRDAPSLRSRRPGAASPIPKGPPPRPASGERLSDQHLTKTALCGIMEEPRRSTPSRPAGGHCMAKAGLFLCHRRAAASFRCAGFGPRYPRGRAS